MQCDRTGPTQIVGIRLCPAHAGLFRADQLARAGSRASRSRPPRSTTNTRCRRRSRPTSARSSRAPCSMIALRHAADAGAQPERSNEDKIPTTSPGFGISASADGKRYPVSVPDRRDLLVAGRRRGPVRQGQARRQPEGQEDRLCLYDNPAGKEPMPILEDLQKTGGLRAAHLRGAAAGGRDGGAGARHHPALPAGFRDRRTCSAARRRWRSRSTSAPAIRCRR